MSDATERADVQAGRELLDSGLVHIRFGQYAKGERLIRASFDSLAAALQTAEEALATIAWNAESWHVGDDGKARALAVIAKWARDPASIPTGVRRPALVSGLPAQEETRG